MKGNLQRAWNPNVVNHAGMTMTGILLKRFRGGVQYATVERAFEREPDAHTTTYNDHSESLRCVRSSVKGLISCVLQRLSSRGCSRGRDARISDVQQHIFKHRRREIQAPNLHLQRRGLT